MKINTRRHSYCARRRRRYAFPNEADPGYFEGKILDGITALFTGMGTVTLFFYLMTL